MNEWVPPTVCYCYGVHSCLWLRQKGKPGLPSSDRAHLLPPKGKIKRKRMKDGNRSKEKLSLSFLPVCLQRRVPSWWSWSADKSDGHRVCAT